MAGAQGWYKRTWMDHLSTMLQCNLDDLIAGQIGPDRCVLAALADDVGLVGL